MMTNATDNELLLVEDNPADADLFQLLLQDAGLNHQQVRHVQNITDALRELKNHSVGLVLLDLRLPDGTGVDNVKSVRNVSDDIPIIVLTGIDDEELAISCIDAGAQDYLCKGEVHPVSLRRAIGYAVTRLRETRSRENQIRSLESQLAQAQKMEAIGQLAGGVAHDFNNLLTIINGYAEIVLEDQSISHPAREMITAILDSGRRAAGLTQRLLAFGRKSVFNPTTLDINPLIADMQKMLQRLIGADIELCTSLDASLDMAKADPSQIDQIIMNLVVNARDAMPNGGKITIETHNVDWNPDARNAGTDLKPGRYVQLKIADTGTGMSEEVRSHVFEPFFTTKEVGKGTGLGLATVYGIVRQCGGRISVSSEFGKGTTFCIYLPCVEGTARQENVNSGARVFPSGTETILLVDDEDDVRQLAQTMLQSAGYNVLATSGGKEAMALAADPDITIHLLLADVVMPQMSGVRLAKAIMTSRPAIRILLMSGRTRDDVFHGDDLCTQIPFLHKPFSSVSLTRKVRDVLDQPLADGSEYSSPRPAAA